jgi:transposase
MHHKGGKPLTSSEKRFIVSAKLYFDRNRSDFDIRDSSAQMTADALGIGLASVNRIMADYNKDPESIKRPPLPRGRPKYALGDTHEEAVRSFIRQGNKEGCPMTLEIIRDFLCQRAPEEESFHLRTLANTLDRWGFEFGRGKRTQGLKEKEYVIALRRRYLRKMRANRSVNGSIFRPEVYLDESYINKNHSKDFTWFWKEDGPWIQKPTGKGERLIIINAITKDGWVPGAKLVFKSTQKTGDYHGQMNWDLFRKWFSESLLPNIPERSLIVLDNAAYHNVLASHSAPTPYCSKTKILSWLESRGIPCREDCLKAELVEILRKFAPEPTYALDELAKEQGHEIVRTPPYHPELQPIEVCWGITKNEVARHCDFTMKGLQKQLELAFQKVTGETCKKIIKKIRVVQDNYWKEDESLEENLSL